MIDDPFLQKLHQFFIDHERHKLIQKNVFAAGTAPMARERSEIREIFFATEFDKAYFIDPMYQVSQVLEIDLANLASFATDISFISKSAVSCTIRGKKHFLFFESGDATYPQNMPPGFSIYFSGKRIGMYPGFGLRGSPSDYLCEIVEKLLRGGYVVPDRELADDTLFFPIPPRELGLQEVSHIRTKRKDNLLSEDKHFFKQTQKGISLYQKI